MCSMNGGVIPDKMRGITKANFAGVLNELQQERNHAVQQVSRLDEAIAALSKLVGSNHTSLRR